MVWHQANIAKEAFASPKVRTTVALKQWRLKLWNARDFGFTNCLDPVWTEQDIVETKVTKKNDVRIGYN